MRKIGHFEFGKDLRPINLGCVQQTNEVLQLWEDGQVIRGWAHYWSQVYDHVYSVLQHNSRLSNATLLFSHQYLCNEPISAYRDLLEHCQLFQTKEAHEMVTTMLGRTKSYDVMFSKEERSIILEETSVVASKFGVYT